MLFLVMIIVVVIAIFTVPSGPPQNFTVITTSDFLLFTWSPPLLSQRNGVITQYDVICTVQNTTLSRQTSSTSASSTNLATLAATKYTCFVCAGTVVGYGPPSETNTSQDDTHSQKEPDSDNSQPQRPRRSSRQSVPPTRYGTYVQH